MKTPYEILDVAVEASDVEIKQAYLRQVKTNPPDRAQEQFQLIHKAYTSIKDHKSRVSYALFTLPTANFNTLIDQALNTGHTIALNPKHFNQLLSASIDESIFSNFIANSEK
jgi:DnaJ-class molecular chaperone